MVASLLYYRPWRGQYRAAVWSIWPIARISLWMMFRRKIFWCLYAFALLIFLMFFFGQYMLAWAESQSSEQLVRVGLVRTRPGEMISLLKEVLRLNGTGYTYRNFFWYQGYMVMIALALAGSILVGNDFQFGSLPFYLSKPMGRWHYLGGKCLAVAAFVHLLTTVPALILFVQYGLLDSWSYFSDSFRLLLGIVAYGLTLSVCLSLMIVAAATWLRKTVPLIMTWTTFFLFFRLLALAMVDGFKYSPRWRLIDLWNNTYIVGNALLGMPHDTLRPSSQPTVLEAALVLGGLSCICLIYLNLRIRAVEIVR
jgi:ABC-type transport system involved in multi-copper enzyme maturation permease subunit